MPANSRPTKPSRKTSKKAAPKVHKKVANKASKKVSKKASKKVAKKVAKKATTKPGNKVAKKTARRPQGSRQKTVRVSAESRHEMIAKAAYYRAEKRNFQDGDPVADWLSCEKEVDILMSKASS